MKKTSAVPLRKETVRVTLKADPKDSAAPKPPSPPSGNQPPAPAPTIPLKTSGPGTTPLPTSGAPSPPPTAPSVPSPPPTSPVTPAPAPTVKLQTGAATQPATPAPTVQLNTPAATGPAPTTPLTSGSSQPLPKATVQLQQTQPMGAPGAASQAATIHTANEDDANTRGEGASAGLSVVALIAALIVLGVQIATANIWIDGDWGRLFE